MASLQRVAFVLAMKVTAPYRSCWCGATGERRQDLRIWLDSLAIRGPLIEWNLPVAQQEGEMLQSSISTCLRTLRVIGGRVDGFLDGKHMGSLKPQMRITKIEPSGELVPIAAGWAGQ